MAVENDSGESSLDKEEHYKQVCRNSRGGGKKPAGFLDARSTHSKTDGTAVSRLQKRCVLQFIECVEGNGPAV